MKNRRGCALKGHDFSRADKLFLFTLAGFSPRGLFFSDFFSNLFSR